MSDNIFVKYTRENPNFYDGYWRNNPRRNAQCTPILYRDNYKPYFKSDLNYRLSNQNVCQVQENKNVEGFANIGDNKTQIVRNEVVNRKNEQSGLAQQINDDNLDSYHYLGKDKLESIKCNGDKASIKMFDEPERMYDINLPSIMKKEVIGDIKEIDQIHNFKIKNSLQYGDMKLQHLKNTMQNLHYQVNSRLLEVHERHFHQEKFFNQN